MQVVSEYGAMKGHKQKWRLRRTSTFFMDALVVKPRARGDTAFVPVLSSLTFSTAAIFPHDANKISLELQAMTEGEEGLVKFVAMKIDDELLWLHTKGLVIL